jgi:MFS family permease
LFLVARAAQGVGTALTLACAPALALSLYSHERRTAALAGFAGSQALASAIGPVLGGVLVALWDWPAIYWVRVPIALAALAASGLLPKPARRDSRFDGWGAVLLALWMSAGLLSIAFMQRAGMASLVPGLLAVAGLGFAAFLWRERRFVEPIIRPALFGDAAFAIPNAINLLANLAGFVILLLTPYYLLDTLGLSVVTGGAVLALQFVGAILGAWLAARLVPRFGRRPMAFGGVLLQGLLLLALGRSAADTPLLAIGAALAAIGVAQGILNVAYTDVVTGTLAPHDRGVAGSLSLLTRTLGVVTGATVISALHAMGAGEPASFLAGYRYAVTCAGGGLVVALALSCLWPRAWFARD